MEQKDTTVNREFASEFQADDNYSHGPLQSPTLGHVQWNSSTIENQTAHEQVRYLFCYRQIWT